MLSFIMDFGNSTNQSLVRRLESSGVLRDKRIKKAILKFDRVNFVLPRFKNLAYLDSPLSIGAGQTISQPTTVVYMLELLEVKLGHKVLEIGAGSGWVCALLSNLVGSKGKVFGYEIQPFVAQLGQKNLKRYRLNNVWYKNQDYRKSFLKDSPYDRILASAAFDKIPQDLLNSLKQGGKLVAPTADGYINLYTREKEQFKLLQHYGFAFVPITGE